MVKRSDEEAPATNEEIPHDHLFKVTGLSSNDLKKPEHDSTPRPSDFEEAITATGYGKFNILLLLATFPAYWSAVSVTTSVSYTYTRAQCDMNLSLLGMGTVSGMTYAGMICSAMMWGFLSDTLGRRKIMVWGFFASGLMEIIAAMSQNFTMLLVARYACGFMFNGPFAVLLSYFAEMHRTDLRSRVILLTNLFYTIASTTLPLLAWGILTQDVDLYIYDKRFVLHSWNLFLLATALMPLLTSLAFFFLPESPKFLMSRGRNDEAMKVFKLIYRLNTGKSGDTFPVEYLVQEKTEEQPRGLAALRGGAAQLAPLFKLPHVPWLLLICIIHNGSMFGTNTLRLWYPQVIAMIGSGNGTLCSAIAPVTAVVTEEICTPIETDMMTYLKTAIVGMGSILTFGIGGAVVNKCGKKVVAAVCSLASAVIVILMPVLGTSSISVVAMFTAAFGFTALLAASLGSIAVELFPTSLRVLAMATFLMMGRLGTLTGSVTFPALIQYGCYPPFITITTVLTVCGCACFFVPSTTLKRLD